MTVLINKTLTSDVNAGTAAFTSITGFGVGTLSPSGIYTHVKLTLTPALTGVDLLINALWIGHAAAAGDAFDYDGNQVRVTVGGSNTFTLVHSGSQLVSDLIKFPIDVSKAVLCAYDGASNASARSVRRLVGSSGVSIYFGGGTQGSDAATTNKTGYSASSNNQDIIAKIEAFNLKRSHIGTPILG